MARAFCGYPEVSDAILGIQKELVDLMGELATEEADLERYKSKGYRCVDEAMVERITGLIQDLEQREKISFRHWATPGASRESAVLDLARTACRRAEREVIALRESGCRVNHSTIPYLNRVSDLCWLFARWIETRQGLA
jgi:cob(I)alamin adenosyltransferase